MANQRLLGLDHDSPKYGTHMAALDNDKQRALVTYIVNNGETSWTKAAIAAGYAPDNYQSAKATAYRLAHDPRITAAIREEGERRASNHLGMALQTIIEMAGNPQHKDSFKAAQMIAGIAGISVVARTEHHVVHHNLMDDVRAAAQVLGVDADALMRGRIAETLTHVTDAEYAEAADPKGMW